MEQEKQIIEQEEAPVEEAVMDSPKRKSNASVSNDSFDWETFEIGRAHV